MNWHLSLLLYYIFSVLRSLGQRRYLKKTVIPSGVVSAMTQLLGIWPLGIVIGLLLPHHIHWSWWLVFLLILEGSMIGLYNKLAFRAIRQMPISHFQTLNQSFNVFVILQGWLLLHETLTVSQMIGISCILGASVISVFAARARAKQQTTAPGMVRLVLIAAVIISIGLVAEKAAIGHMDNGAYFIFGYGTQTISAVIIAYKDTRKQLLRAFTHSDIRNYIVIGAVSATAGFLYLYTVKHANNISLIISLTAFTLPLTAFASYWLLHEREDIRRLWLSIGLGVIGIIITAL